MQHEKRIDSNILNLGFVPPHSIELEEAVLGAALLEKDGTRTVINYLKSPEYFYKLEHQEIFKAIQQLWQEGTQPETVTVMLQLNKNGQLETVGGAHKLFELTTRVQSAGNLTAHCLLIKEQYTRRELIRSSTLVIAQAYDQTTDIFNIVSDAQQVLNVANETLTIKEPQTLASLYPTALKEIEAAAESNGVTGVPTGLEDVDNVTGGHQPGDLIIYAGRPAMGKTSYMLTIARNAAIKYNKKLAIFSLEMSSTQLVKKLIATETREYSTSQLTRGYIGDKEEGKAGDKKEGLARIRAKSQSLNTSNILLDDDPGLTISLLDAKVARLIALYGIEEILVDYLQLMEGERGQGQTREQVIASISRGLKKIAKKYNIPVIALSQLSRSVESRSDKKPQLSDLRESGAIEQDADFVAFLYRAEYYGITEDSEGNPTKNIGEVIIAKHRNGATCPVLLKCEIEIGRFSNLYLNGTVPTDSNQVINNFPPSNFENEGKKDDLPF